MKNTKQLISAHLQRKISKAFSAFLTVKRFEFKNSEEKLKSFIKL